MSTEGNEVIQRMRASEVEGLEERVPGATREVILSYLYAKAQGKATDLEIDSYPNGQCYVTLKRDVPILEPSLRMWECADGSFVIVRGDSRPEGAAMDRSDYLNDNVYRDTVALRSGQLSKLQNMYGDLSGKFSGPGRLGSLMSNISEKHEQVIALWEAERSGGWTEGLARHVAGGGGEYRQDVMVTAPAVVRRYFLIVLAGALVATGITTWIMSRSLHGLSRNQLKPEEIPSTIFLTGLGLFIFVVTLATALAPTRVLNNTAMLWLFNACRTRRVSNVRAAIGFVAFLAVFLGCGPPILVLFNPIVQKVGTWLYGSP